MEYTGLESKTDQRHRREVDSAPYLKGADRAAAGVRSAGGLRREVSKTSPDDSKWRKEWNRKLQADSRSKKDRRIVLSKSSLNYSARRRSNHWEIQMKRCNVRVEHPHAQRSFIRDPRRRVNRQSAGTGSLVGSEYAADQNTKICLLRKGRPRHQHCANNRYKRFLQNDLTAEVSAPTIIWGTKSDLHTRAPTLALFVVHTTVEI